jgi:hypothetical protein
VADMKPLAKTAATPWEPIVAGYAVTRLDLKVNARVHLEAGRKIGRQADGLRSRFGRAKPGCLRNAELCLYAN